MRILNRLIQRDIAIRLSSFTGLKWTSENSDIVLTRQAKSTISEETSALHENLKSLGFSIFPKVKILEEKKGQQILKFIFTKDNYQDLDYHLPAREKSKTARIKKLLGHHQKPKEIELKEQLVISAPEPVIREAASLPLPKLVLNKTLTDINQQKELELGRLQSSLAMTMKLFNPIAKEYEHRIKIGRTKLTDADTSVLEASYQRLLMDKDKLEEEIKVAKLIVDSNLVKLGEEPRYHMPTPNLEEKEAESSLSHTISL